MIDLKLEFKRETGLTALDAETLENDLDYKMSEVKEKALDLLDDLKLIKIESDAFSEDEEIIYNTVEELKDIGELCTESFNFEYIKWLEEKLTERWIF